jgi:hypothetical protein
MFLINSFIETFYRRVSIINFFFFSYFLLILNNFVINLDSESAKFFKQNPVEIESIYSDKKVIHLSTVERSVKFNEQFNEFAAAQSIFGEISEKTKKDFFGSDLKKNLVYDLNSKDWHFAILEGSDGNYYLDINLKKKLKNAKIIVVYDSIRVPKNFSLNLLDENKSVYISDTIFNKNNFSKPFVWITHKIISNDEFNRIKINIYDYYNVRERAHIINEVFIFELEDISFFQKLYNFLIIFDKSALSYFSISLLYSCIILITGLPLYFFLNKIHPFFTPDKILPLSTLFGFCILTIFSILSFFFINFIYLYLIFFLFALAQAFRKRNLLNFQQKKILVFSAFVLYCFSSIHYFYSGDFIGGSGYFNDLVFDFKKSAGMALPYHPFYLPYDFDYHLPWATTKHMIHNFDKASLDYQMLFGAHDPYERSMLIPFIGVLITKIFGEKYFFFHCFMISSVFFSTIGLYYLFSSFYSQKYIPAVILLLNTSTFFIFNNVMVGNKNFTIFFSIFSLIFIMGFLKEKNLINIIISSLFFLLSTFAHIYVLPMVLIFIIFIFLESPKVDKFIIKSIIILIFFSALGFIIYLIPKFYVDSPSFLSYILFGKLSAENIDRFNPGLKSLSLSFKDNLFLILNDKYYAIKSLFYPNPYPNMSIPTGYRVSTFWGLTGISLFIFLFFNSKNFIRKNKNFMLAITLSIPLYILLVQLPFNYGVFVFTPLFAYFIISLCYYSFLKFYLKNKTIGLIFLITGLYENFRYFKSNKFEHIPIEFLYPYSIGMSLSLIFIFVVYAITFLTLKKSKS